MKRLFYFLWLMQVSLWGKDRGKIYKTRKQFIRHSWKLAKEIIKTE